MNLMVEPNLKRDQVRFRVAGMDCANCALTLERSLGQLKGVEHIQVNFTTATLEASGSFDYQEFNQRVQALGYSLTQIEQASSAETAEQGGALGFLAYLLSDRQARFVFLAAGLLGVRAGLGIASLGTWTAWVEVVLGLAAIGLAGFPIAQKGFRALWFGKQITIDLLMTIATLGAAAIGEVGEAATVILLFVIGEALEGYSAERSRRSLRSLLALKPEKATLLRPCMDCAEHLGKDGYEGGACPFCGVHAVEVPIAQVAVGETVLVKPGERIPVDGQVLQGISAVNQASVTGESLPVDKQAGESVFAGTLNGEGALEIQVTRFAEDSTISRIVRLVEQAQTQRAPVERFVDRFASWYTPAVVLMAVLVAALPPLMFGEPFLDTPDGAHGWLYRALALLIIACPCALVISTPVTVVSALTGLAQRGVLVKGGAFLDELARVRVFAFDKTGTLTLGKPAVQQVRTLACPPGHTRCDACDDLLLMATALESRSEHPLAQAVLAEADSRQILHRMPAASQVTSLAGRGIKGIVNGANLMVSSHSHGHENFSEDDILHEQIEQAERSGQTVMVVSQDDRVLGYVSVADSQRTSSRQALSALKAMDRQFHFVMLTGDHAGAAQRIAAEIAALDELRAGLLPEDKVSTVESLKKTHGAVAMIGDGVNDAPALAAASVGIAMGGAGSAQAMETADIVLMQDDLAHLPDLVRTSRRTQQVIWQNILFSLGLKGIFMLLAIPGWTTLWMAVFADMGASLLVTLNGMRMLRKG